MDNFEQNLECLRGRAGYDPVVERRAVSSLTDYFRSCVSVQPARVGSNDEIDIEQHKLVRFTTPKFLLDVDDDGNMPVMLGVVPTSLRCGVAVPVPLPDLTKPFAGKLRTLFETSALALADAVVQHKPLFMLEGLTPYVKREAFTFEFLAWCTIVTRK